VQDVGGKVKCALRVGKPVSRADRSRRKKRDGNGYVVWWGERFDRYGLVESVGVLRLRLRITLILQKVVVITSSATATAMQFGGGKGSIGMG
jgi:hypothetical protein